MIKNMLFAFASNDRKLGELLSLIWRYKEVLACISDSYDLMAWIIQDIFIFRFARLAFLYRDKLPYGDHLNAYHNRSSVYRDIQVFPQRFKPAAIQPSHSSYVLQANVSTIELDMRLLTL
jgi:hypothetical protein